MMCRIIWLVCACLFAFKANAESIDYFKVEGVEYDPSITTPDRFLGHGLGEKPVRHDMMVGYLRSLAQASPRISVETIGYSHEGRPILFFVVTSPENQQNIEEIRQSHLERLTPGAQPKDGPAVVWLNYGVHGAESSGMDAAIPTLYHLAAAKGEKIDQTLEETVILVTAIFNPDGHSRRINHVYTYLGDAKVTDPAHTQHNLWVEARTNHYWFDLNRDWLLLTQPESRAWIKKWHAWKPNVSADYHEMGSNSTYYFHPGVPKRKNPLIPTRERELLSIIAEEHAAWLDSAGELYTSEEGFDNFYIGKGSTYPSINGSVGILFEAAAARGGKIDTENGLRTYAQNIRIHFNTSLTTIEGSRKNREALRDYQKSFFTDALKSARDGDVKAYIFTTAGDEARLKTFIDLLRSHDIMVNKLARDVTADERIFDAASSYIIALSQPQYTMIRGIFDQLTKFEESVFYDVSGWTLPLAYDLDYAALDGKRFSTSLIGESASLQNKKPTPNESQYGYIFDWEDYYAPRALSRFLQAGALARTMIRPKKVSVNGNLRSFNEGAIFIPLSGQSLDSETLFELAKLAASEDGVDIYPVDSGNAAPGVGDLGSRGSMRSLEQPKIMMLYDDGIARYGAGQLWHLLDHKMKTPVVLRRKNSISGVDLSDYTHIIVPGAWGPISEEGFFNEGDMAALTSWIQRGGILIATKTHCRLGSESMAFGICLRGRLRTG